MEYVMDNSKVCRMSMLFEKMVSDSATNKEQYELKSLYSEYIDDGRQKLFNNKESVSTVKPLTANL